MNSTTKGIETYRAGGLGTPSAGPDPGVRAGPAGSLSDDCEVEVVEIQATPPTNATGDSSVSDALRPPSSRPDRRRRRQATAGNDGPEGWESDSSRASTASRSSTTTTSKKRAGPPIKVEAAAKRAAGRAQTARIDSESRDGGSDPGAPLPPVEQLVCEMQNQATGTLGAYISQRMRVVERVSTISKNLKGDLVRDLQEAARITEAAATELIKRSAVTGDAQWLEKENLHLRNQMADLRREVDSLRGAMEALKRRAPAPPAERLQKARSDALGAGKTPAGPVVRSGPAKAEPPLDTRHLLKEVAKMMDAKLAAFKRELLPPRSKEQTGRATAAVQRTQQPHRGTRGPATREQPAPPKARQPPPPTKTQETWSQVVGRKAKRKEKKAAVAAAKTPPPPPAKPARKAAAAPGPGGKKGGIRPRLSRPPRTAAVTLSAAPSAAINMGDAITRAKEAISLQELGIEGVRTRRAVTGGIVLEVAGPDNTAKAQALAEKMTAVLAGTGIRVGRPSKLAELRVKGLDDSVKTTDVRAAVAAAGGCRSEEVRTGEIRRTTSDLGVVWVRCPLVAARKLASTGRIRVGWSIARVEALERRALQCFRCLESGHVMQRCTSATDRGSRCYRCGIAGHRAAACTATPRCPLCADLGRPSGHRLGGRGCAPPPSKGRRRDGARGPAPPLATAAASTSTAGAEPKEDKAPGAPGRGQEEAMEAD